MFLLPVNDGALLTQFVSCFPFITLLFKCLQKTLIKFVFHKQQEGAFVSILTLDFATVMLRVD